RKVAPRLDLRNRTDDIEKLRTGRRFAVAGKGNVIEPTQRGGRVLEALHFEEIAGVYRFEHLFQLRDEPRDHDIPCHSGRLAIDLAIDAIEVADLVWI